jgi:hypothetical protein
MRWLAAIAAALLIGGVSAAAAADKDPSPAWVTSVIVKDPIKLDKERFSSALRKRISAADRLETIELDEKENFLFVRVGGGTALISGMPGPIPNGELQEVCKLTWYWPESCATVADHRAHVLVLLMAPQGDRLQGALLQTKIIAALVESTPAIATYWGTQLQRPEVFLKSSADATREKPPVPLWVMFRISRNDAGHPSLSTSGMRSFDLMEIEAKDAPMPVTELLDLSLGMAQYLITKGPIIKDRDTVGHTNTQRIRVRHTESYWRKGEKVYRIDFAG